MCNWFKCKKVKERISRARDREEIIFERYFLKGEKLIDIANDIGMSLSGIEKVAHRVKQKYNLPVKRKLTGEALDDPVVCYSENKKEIYLLYTAKQYEKLGFKYSQYMNSLVKNTWTKKNGKKYYFVLAKDYKKQGFESKAIMQEIARIKMKSLGF